MRDGWRETTLGALCTITKGTSPTQKTLPGAYPLIVTGPQPLSSGSFQFDGEAVCVPLVSSTGHGHASLKRVHYASGKFAVANIIAACVPRVEAGVAARFLFHYLQHFKDVEIVTRMKGTANVSLSITNLATVPVTLPSLEEQRRIVDLIAAIDDAVDAAEAEAHCSQRAWSVVCNAIAESTDATERNVAQLVSTAKSGGTPSRANPAFYGGTIPWLKSGEVRGREITTTSEAITEEALAESSAWLAPAESVLVAMYGGGTVGQVGQLAAPMATNQAVLALVAESAVIAPRMLYHLLAAHSDRLAAKASGAAQVNLSKKLVLDHVVHVPSLERQGELTDALDALLDAYDAARSAAESLRTLRSNLLTVLLSGEHEIPSSYDELRGENA